MELGIYHEFPVLPGRSQAECFAAGFDIVDASEEYGLDVMWIAELHFDKRRAAYKCFETREVNELVPLPPQFIGHHGRLRLHRRYHADSDRKSTRLNSSH